MAVGLFASHPADLERVARLLEQQGFDVTSSVSWSSFSAQLSFFETIVVAIPWLDEDLPTAQLRAVIRRRPWAVNILLTEDDSQNLRLLGRTGFADVLFLKKEEGQLPALLYRAPLNTFFTRISEALRRDHSLPAALRSALLLVTEYEPSALPQSDDDPMQPIRSVRSLAHRVVHSEDHLTRMARENGFELRAFLDWCIALRALQLHWGRGERWELIAWRFGYASSSGLSEHLKHTLGLRPREISAGELERLFQEFEDRFVIARDAEFLRKSR